MAKKVVVIRIGAKTTHIVHMEYMTNNPTIYGCMRIPTPEGAYDDGMIRDVMEMGQLIKKACREKGIHTTDAIFTVESSKIANRETTIPFVAKAKIKQNVMAKVPDLFPVDSERYVFSYVLQGKEYENTDIEHGELGSKVQDVHIFAAPSELIDSYYALADASGLRVEAVEADGNSVFQIMRRQVKEGITMSVQVNQNSTLVNIIDGEKMYLQRVIPYGINVFTEVMTQEEAFETPDVDQAYELLVTKKVLLSAMNMEVPEDDFSMAKRSEVTDNAEYLISNIVRVMEYYNSRYKEKPIQRIICIGQGCSVAGLPELLTNELGVTVSTPNELDGVRFNHKVAINSTILQYVNCFGSVFCPVRFMPRALELKEANKGTLVGSVLIFAGLMLGSIVLAAFSFLQVYVATQDRDTIQAKVQALEPVESEYNRLKKVESNYALKELLRFFVQRNNNSFHKTMNTLSDMLPKSFRIESIQSDDDKVTISARSKDKLSSLSALKMQMAKISNLKNVKIDSIAENKEQATNRRVYTYTLTFEYVQPWDKGSKEMDKLRAALERKEGGQ